MKKPAWTAGIWALAILACGFAAAQPPDPVVNELDAYWQEVARTVGTGDFEAYAKGYHADAVYVSETEQVSHPIALALDKWRQGFLDTEQGRTHPSVDFRFSQRLHDANSAHETGIFRYSSGNDEKEETVVYVHFEALLVKQGRWLTLMEYQKNPATEDEWNSL